MSDSPNVTLVREYLDAVARGDSSDDLRKYLDAGYQQTEFPNTLNPKGGQSDLADSLVRAEKGKKLLRAQRYEVRTAISVGDTVALEVDWTGTLDIPALGLPSGGKMKAHFAMFIELRAGKILRQRNYDCFEPW